MGDSIFDDNKDLRKKDSFFEDSKDLRKKDSFFDDSKELRKNSDSFFDKSNRDSEERRKEFFNDFGKDSIFSDKRRESAFDDIRRDSFGTALSNSRHGSIFDNRPSSSLSRDRSASLFEEENGVSKVVYEDDLYKILINVDKYQPEELMIKTIDNNVIVEAKHEEKTSDGRSFSTQSFNQSFNLPRSQSRISDVLIVKIRNTHNLRSSSKAFEVEWWRKTNTNQTFMKSSLNILYSCIGVKYCYCGVFTIIDQIKICILYS